MGAHRVANVGLAVGILLGSLSTGAPASADPVREAQYWIAQLGLDRAWKLSEGAGVTVGVIDTGVSDQHPDLSGAVLPGTTVPDLGEGAPDAWGHGTAIAVLIAGRGRGGTDGTLGVAPRSMVLPVKLVGGASSASEAIHWAVDHGAKVINLSVGREASSARQNQAYDEGLSYAREHDVVVVAAAGNARQDKGVVSPANRPGAIAVSTVDRTGEFRPEISVEGPEVALAAPGAAILTLTPTPGGPSDGTSYSAAMVSGVAALVRAKFPELDAEGVVRRLTSTARDAGSPGRDPRYGFGIVDPVAALTADLPGTDRSSWLVPAAVAAGLAATAIAALAIRRIRRRRA